MSRDLIVGRVPKNEREAIGVRLLGQSQLCDVRLSTVKRGKHKATAGGFNLEPASLPVLIGLLQRAHAQARAAGWCADG
jgi:hypothetical protein